MRISDLPISPIPTTYRGVHFRSRLEAKWAVFLDALEIKWEYEPEGFDLGGIWYLPDFWLPDFECGMFLEVKPGEFTAQEREKCERLCRLTRREVWLGVGEPDFRAYEYYRLMGKRGEEKLVIFRGAPNACAAEGEDEMYQDTWWGGVDYPDMRIDPEQIPSGKNIWKYAVYEVKAYRFDHIKRGA